MTINSLADFAPEGTETGVGLALQDSQGRFLFFLAGTRHHCPPGELFYAGVGGHREEGEDWLACAHREAMEETGTDVEVLASSTTWHIPNRGSVRQVETHDRPRPLALYEFVHPAGTPRAGGLYYIAIYRARLHGAPSDMSPEEQQGIIAMTPEQVIRGLNRRPSLARLLDEGAQLLTGGERLNPQVRLYPLGTARALAHVLRQTREKS